MANTKFKLNITQIIGIVCILLMIALAVTQFLPFWTFGEDNTTISISEHTWFNYRAEYKSFIKEMKNQLVAAQLMDKTAKLQINDFVYPSAVLTLVALFAFIICPFKLGKPLGIAFNLAVGGIGIWMYLSHPIYQLGQNWIIGFAISIALAVLALANAIIYIVKLRND